MNLSMKQKGKNLKRMVEFDAVFPYGGKEHFEAEQAVRLLRKHAKGLRDIYFIGESIPGVIHVPFVETDKKEINIWLKTLTASLMDISERFLFMNDDHFIQQDFEDIPYYHCGYLANYPADEYYSVVIKRTIENLEKRGLNTFNFDIHTPFFVEKSKFLEVFNEFDPRLEITMKSCYCNYLGIEGQYEPDMKIKSLMERWEFEPSLRDKFCFSTHENCITRDLRDYILQL